MEYTSDWFSNNIPIWEKVLAEFKDKPIKALEIGSFEGRSTVWLLENILTHPDAHIICVDPFKPYSDLNKENINWDQVYERFLANIEPFGAKVEVWKQTSQECLPLADQNQFDLIYVDGGHTSEQALIDGVLSHLLLKPGGIIIFDDYMWGKLEKASNVPKMAIDAFMDCFAIQYEWISTGYQVLLRKKF